MQAKRQKRHVGELLEHKAQALMGATRLASGKVQLLFSRACIVFFSFIIPTRDASPPLELAFRVKGAALCNVLRLRLDFLCYLVFCHIAMCFYGIGRANFGHRESGLSVAPTLFSGSLCRNSLLAPITTRLHIRWGADCTNGLTP